MLFPQPVNIGRYAQPLHHAEGKVGYNLRAIKTFGNRHVGKLPEWNLRGRQS
jgi:hypothetical protein